MNPDAKAAVENELKGTFGTRVPSPDFAISADDLPGMMVSLLFSCICWILVCSVRC